MNNDDLVRRPGRSGPRRSPSATGADRVGQPPAPSTDEPPSDRGSSGDDRELRRYDESRANAASAALGLRTQLDRIQAQTRSLAARQERESAAVLRAAVDTARATADDQTRQVQTRSTERRHALSERIRAAVADIAPGAAGAAPGELAGLSQGHAGYPTHVRLGELPLGGMPPAPVVVPVLDATGLYVAGSMHVGSVLARDIVCRIAASIPLKHVSIHVFDPRMSGVFGPLAPLRGASGAAFPLPLSDGAAFAERLGQVMGKANLNAEMIGAAGCRTLGEVWAGQDVPEGTREIVVVLNYPYGVDQRLDEQLMRITGSGGRSGVTLLVIEDDQATPGEEISVASLKSTLFDVGLSDQGATASLPGYPPRVAVDPPLDAERLRDLVGVAISRAEQSQGPVFPLGALLADDLREPWTNSSATGLDMVIGRDAREPLVLSLRSQNPPHPNLLVGGAVGQGKSNLLLDMIYSLAVRYPPADLELHLLDFKQGLEFARFAAEPDGTGWLPHVKVLSLESNLAFGVAVLRHMESELDRRSELFKQAGTSSIDDYRAMGRALPRALLIIDEFHVLFEGDDELVDVAVDLMSRLAKQGRAYGIHLLLASQTISGIRSLATRGDAIFAQFPLRISLKNTAQESQAILAQGNTAAAALSYRGEVIVNRNFGGDPHGSNVRGTAAYADKDELREVQRRLWELGHDDPPMMFVGTAFARWDPSSAQVPSGRDPVTDGLRLLVGRPLAVTDEPVALTLDSDADQGVAVVGKDDQVAAAVLAALTLSALPDLGAHRGELVLLAGAPQASGWESTILNAARRHGVVVQVIERDGIANYLRESLAPRLDDRGAVPLLVVGVALQRARDLDRLPESAPEGDVGFATFDFDTPTDQLTAHDALREGMRRGAMSGVFVVASWSTVRTMEAALGLGSPGASHIIGAGLGLEDLRTVAGVTARPPDGRPRATLWVKSESTLTTVIPFDVMDPSVAT